MEGPRRCTLKEVAMQNGADGKKIWIVLHDMVYDVTNYIKKHPGGPELIEEYAGQDATRGFDEFGHSSDAKRLLKGFLIGELTDEDKMSCRRKKGPSHNEESSRTKARSRFLSVLCGKCTT